MIVVSMPLAVSVEASEVPKKADGYCFEMTSSPGSGFSPFGQAPSGLPTSNERSAGTLRKNTPPFAPPF